MTSPAVGSTSSQNTIVSVLSEPLIPAPLIKFVVLSTSLGTPSSCSTTTLLRVTAAQCSRVVRPHYPKKTVSLRRSMVIPRRSMVSSRRSTISSMRITAASLLHQTAMSRTTMTKRWITSGLPPLQANIKLITQAISHSAMKCSKEHRNAGT